MYYAMNGEIPPENYYHDPTIKDKNGYTVAMMLVIHGKVPPKEWMHDNSIKDNRGKTL